MSAFQRLGIAGFHCIWTCRKSLVQALRSHM